MSQWQGDPGVSWRYQAMLRPVLDLTLRSDAAWQVAARRPLESMAQKAM